MVTRNKLLILAYAKPISCPIIYLHPFSNVKQHAWYIQDTYMQIEQKGTIDTFTGFVNTYFHNSLKLNSTRLFTINISASPIHVYKTNTKSMFLKKHLKS